MAANGCANRTAGLFSRVEFAVNGRRVPSGIFWVLRSGAPWRDLPETNAPFVKIASFDGGATASGTGSWMHLAEDRGRCDASVCSAIVVRACQMSNEEAAPRLRQGWAAAPCAEPAALVLSRDGSLAAAGRENGRIRLFIVPAWRSLSFAIPASSPRLPSRRRVPCCWLAAAMAYEAFSSRASI